MAIKVQPLTATKIKPKDKEYNLGYGDGLSLKVKSIGTKLWCFSYYYPITRKAPLTEWVISVTIGWVFVFTFDYPCLLEN